MFAKLKTALTVGLGFLFCLTIVSGVVLSATKTYAQNDGIVNISVTVPSVCSLSMDDDSHSVTMQAGTQRTIGTSIIKAVCNDPDGLAVYAVGYGNETYGENRLIGSFSGNPQYILSNASFGTPTDSEWNMTLTAITGTYAPTITTGYTTAHAIPTTYTKVAYRNSATDVDATGYTATGANFSARFDVYAAPTQLPGTYQGKVKFLLVHPNVADNSTNPATVQPETLIGTMQNVAQWKLGVSNGQTVYAVDERDGELYSVARLADGKLWMTKNLRLDLSKYGDVLDSSNTNNPASAFLAAASNKPASSNEWCSDATAGCFNQIKYDTSNIGNTASGGDGHKYDNYGTYYNWYTVTAGNGTYGMTSGDVTGDICPFGWHLPTGTSTSSAPSTWAGDYWELGMALAGFNQITDSQVNLVINQENGIRFQASPQNFVLAGYWRQGGAKVSVGENGCYWTSTATPSTAFSVEGAKVLCFSLSSLSNNPTAPGIGDMPKYDGLSVRCLAD